MAYICTRNTEVTVLRGRIPEWPNGADCKSAVFRLRWFESIFAHYVLKKRMQTSLDGKFKNCLCLFANSLCKRIAEVAQLIEH